MSLANIAAGRPRAGAFQPMLDKRTALRGRWADWGATSALRMPPYAPEGFIVWADK